MVLENQWFRRLVIESIGTARVRLVRRAAGQRLGGREGVVGRTIAGPLDAALAVDVLGPLIAPDHFAARFWFTEQTPAGDIHHTTKFSLCTVEAGRIAREEIFYYTKP